MNGFDFEKQKDFLICIDSDGCAMDTMNVKHIECFGPEWVKQYGLEAIRQEALAYWNRINLFTTTRGINRFKGLALGIMWAKEKGYAAEGADAFIHWTNTAKELSNPALLAACQKTDSPCMENALLWSIHVNRAIHKLPPEDKPFEGAAEAMQYMQSQADLVAVSSANAEAVEKEWGKHGLADACRTLLCQEYGSKAFCIGELLKKGYDKAKTLMVGDAPGDKDSALQNGVLFYPILVNKEKESWLRLQEEAFPKLLAGEFDEEYQQKLIIEFEEILRN